MRQTDPRPTRKKMYKKGKRWMTALLASTLIASGPVSLIGIIPAAPVVAATIVQQGSDGTSTWALDDSGTLTITAGELASRSSASATSPANPWQSYASQITQINITGNVTLNPISRGLFGDLPNLTSITGLDKVDFAGVTDAGGLFYQDRALTDLTFSGDLSSATTLSNIFAQMTNLKTLDLTGMKTSPSPSASLWADALTGDAALTQITFGGQTYTDAATGITLPTAGTWFDASGAAKTAYIHTTGQGTAAQIYKRSTVTATYVDANGQPIMSEGINPDATTYTPKTPWNTAALQNYIFTPTSADDWSSAYTQADIPVTDQNITIPMTKVYATGTVAASNVPWFAIQTSNTDATLHLGSGQLPEGSDTQFSSPFSSLISGLKLTSLSIDQPIKAAVNSGGLFATLTDLTSITGLEKLDTSNTTCMANMFRMLWKLQSGLEGVTNWDTSKVTNMNAMFYGINLVTQSNEVTTNLDLSGWDTRKVTNFTDIFQGTQLNQIKFGTNFKTAQAGPDGVLLPDPSKTDPTKPQVPWLLVPNPTGQKESLIYKDTMIPGTYIRGTAASADMTYQTSTGTTVQTDTIWGALGNSIIYQPIDPWATANLDSFKFLYATSSGEYTDTIPAAVTTTLTSDTTDNQSFTVLPVKAKGIIGSGDNAARWYLSEDNTLTILGGTLSNVDGAATNPWADIQTYDGQIVADVVQKIDVVQPTALGANAAYLFADMPKLASVNFSNLDTAGTTDMSGMFNNDAALTAADLSMFDPSNVTSMKDMFAGASTLSTLTQPSDGLVGSSVTDLSGMFHGDSALTALDVANWDTSNVTDMTDAFNGASALTNLAVDDWQTDKLTAFDGAFANMTSLTSISLGAADSTTAWSTASFDPATQSLTNLFADDSALQTVTFSKAFSAASGISVPLPQATAKLWLRTSDGVALPANEYTGTAASNGTYTLTTATYTVTLIDDKTGQTLGTVTSDPLSAADLGQPLDPDAILADWPGFIPVEDTGPTVGTQFTMTDDVWTQPLTLRVRQVGGPDQFPNAGRDDRLIILTVGTLALFAGLAGMLLLTHKTNKRS
ncbi:MAG: BspA family leucine-rich repeat surface protein [Lactobacillus sp.]|nr:BspA family leucine-rich repeat surface protein [Lactobacillus sp.]MCI1916849.1 BspA family leucine-rich repeat surface protein [Lactobacillus sp.]MCI1942053.1 BspA family leucine-rich repeat surface protein [Lactobacillus sp.]MCI1972484.1 BspA family leucine-rich repeat surface protein [Lactobacillus sp.]MCI2037046.1 BspA family leucine-rich repeat surface protein [Lactobacillus sp.]